MTANTTEALLLKRLDKQVDDALELARSATAGWELSLQHIEALKGVLMVARLELEDTNSDSAVLSLIDLTLGVPAERASPESVSQ